MSYVVNPFPKGSYAISVITGPELLAYPDLSADEEIKIRNFLRDVHIVDLIKLWEKTHEHAP